MVVQVFDSEEKRRIAEAVLRQLPDWFGLPESTKRYIEESAGMPFWVWRGGRKNLPETGAAQEGIKTSGGETQGSGNGKASGFLSLKETSPHTAEIFVMGVLPGEHRRGIGRGLYLAFEEYAREKGYSFVQVKTVQSGHYEEYDRTNSFYRAMGFQELECLPALWDAANPCQIYVKYIGSREP